MNKVEIVSASWCKSCHKVKPDVEALCKAAGVPLSVVDYEKMEEADSAKIKALPTIRTYTATGDHVHTAATLEAWKVIMKSFVQISTEGTDF